MKQPFLFLALLLFLAAACSNDAKETNISGPKAFFDLKGYIQEEMQSLSESQPRVLKRIAIDGNQEEQFFDSLDYKKELAIFSRSDINKSAWFDKYQVDSTFQDGQLIQITYTAKEAGLKTQLMEIEYGAGKVSAIHIRNITRSLVADVFQEMYYRPAKGYSLMSKQSTTLSEEKEVKVEVAFREI